MKFKHLTLAIAFVLVCAASSIAQQTFKIDTKYDRFEDQTSISLQPMKISGGLYDGINIGITFVCLGDVRSCQPEKVFFGFIVVLKGTIYDLPANLIVLADGERFPLGNMSNFGSAEVPPRGWNIIATTLGVVIPRETFLKIARAKKVEMKLDDTELELNMEHRTAVYSLSTLATP
jgi:hypothetical protein